MVPASLALLAAQTATPSLAPWSPKQGEETLYQYVLENKAKGEEFRMTAVMRVQVQAVTRDGSVTKTTPQDALIVLGGQEIRDQRNNPVVVQLGPQGELKQVLEGKQDAGSYDLGRLTRFVSPQGPSIAGAEWRHTVRADRLTPGIDIRYSLRRFATEAGVQVAKVSFTGDSTSGMKAKGEWTIEASTGSPVALSAEAEGVGGEKGIKFGLTMTRIVR